MPTLPAPLPRGPECGRPVDEFTKRQNNLRRLAEKEKVNAMNDREKEARLRQASERLYADSRLRDALTDKQAEQLLAWGFEQVEHGVEHTQTRPAAEGTAVFEGKLEAVHKALRLVNQIVAQLPEASEGRSREYVTQLVDALCEVDARIVQVNDMLVLEELVVQREALSSVDIFQRLLEIMRKQPEEDSTGEEPATGVEKNVTEEEQGLAVANEAGADSAEFNLEEEE